MASNFRSGYVAVVGRPNVGKSTLLNRFLGQKVVIISEKPQTTRNRILCVYTDPTSQILFFDTPGMHKPRDKMNKYMVGQAKSALSEADLVLMLVEFNSKMEIGAGDRYLIQLIRDTQKPFRLVINKIDLGSRDDIEIFGQKWKGWVDGDSIFPASAISGIGFEELLDAIKRALPEGPAYFDDSLLTDRSERFVVGELIREKVFYLMNQEVPYSTAVIVEEMKDRGRDNKMYIKACIYVEAESQKGIMIGNSGAMLKQIGKDAREDIEGLLNCNVFLDLWVKVRPHWRRDQKFIRRLEQPQVCEI